MITDLKKKHFGALLGLAFDGNRLDGVVLRRTNGSVEIRKSFAVTLTLDLLKDDPELLGREIRNRLDEAGIRERECVVGVPLDWALTLQTQIPDLPESDVESFLAIESERGFPYGLDALTIACSRFNAAPNENYATQVAVPRNNVTRLERALRSARLKPLSFSFGLTALHPPQAAESQGVVAIFIGEKSVFLLVTCGGGVASLRTVETAFEAEVGVKRIFADVLAREVRVTLGQLPAGVREQLRTLRVFGSDEASHRLAREIQVRAEAMGLKVEHVSHYTGPQRGLKIQASTTVSPALSLAVQHLSGQAPSFEFLPPRVSWTQQLAEKYSGRKLVWAGAAAASIALLIAIVFGIQQWQLARLESQWKAMRPKVEQLDHVQRQIKRFRPWFDDSFASLSILRKMTEAFPEDGAVAAKTLEIRNLSVVRCSGTARDNQAFLKMIDQLRGVREIGEVQVDMLRGRAPLQFTFNFQWQEGGLREN